MCIGDSLGFGHCIGRRRLHSFGEEELTKTLRIENVCGYYIIIMLGTVHNLNYIKIHDVSEA
jgi:hypothetical protein